MELAFHTAACAGDLKGLQACIDSKQDAAEKDKDGNTVLHWCAHKGDPECMALMLTYQKDVNAKNNAGNTPLHYAAINNRVRAARLLLENKADANAQNRDGQTPLHGAVGRGEVKMIKALCNHMLSTAKVPMGAKGFKRPLGCADPNIKDQEGFTPLHMCTYRLVGGGGIWKALKECGADVDIKGGQWGAEPQHPYVYGFVRIVQWTPIVVLPMVLVWWFIFRPTIIRMRESGDYDSVDWGIFSFMLEL